MRVQVQRGMMQFLKKYAERVKSPNVTLLENKPWLYIYNE